MEENLKVVYLHKKETDGTIFYVGMGELKRAFNTSSRNKWWNRTYAKHGRVVDIVAKDLSIEDAYELEVFLISEIGRKDKGLGSLVNLDDGGEGATGHIPTEYARKVTSERVSKKVINTETLEVLKSGKELLNKYGLFNNILQSDNPKSDWMKLEDYKKGKHLTEKWVNRYKIGLRYLKIINTETLEVFYSIEEAAKSIGKGSYRNNESQYNILSAKLKGSKRNNTDFMYYEDYELGRHLTEEWNNRKAHTPQPPRPPKEIELYDFKEEVWFKITVTEFESNYNITPVLNGFICNKRFCRREYFEKDREAFYNNEFRWKNILDLRTGKVERLNQWYLADKLNTKTNNVSSFIRGKQKVLKKIYKIVA